MKFAAVIEYLKDPAKVAEIRPSHREYLGGLLKEGKLVAAGPFIDDSGALIIYEASNRNDAIQLIQNDPFYHAGIFLNYQLRPWNAVLANKNLFPF